MRPFVSKSVILRYICILTLSCVLVGAQTSYAFTVLDATFFLGYRFSGAPNHENITYSGLVAPEVSAAAWIKRSNQSISFSDAAISIVKGQNRQVDSRFWNSPKYHFDDDKFTEANSLLIDQRWAVIEFVRSKDYLLAQTTLGAALHTVQDFYAHSTWVEKYGNTPYPNLGEKAFGTDKVLAPTKNATCVDSGVIPEAQVTTGWFEPGQVLPIIGGATSYLTPLARPAFGPIDWPLTQNHCVHGTSSLPNSASRGKGINKDNINRVGFSNAEAAAIGSTSAYVVSILKTLSGDAAADDEICGLMGAESTVACINDAANQFIILPTLGGTFGYASGLNNAGQVAGTAFLGGATVFNNGPQHATLWTANTLTDIDRTLDSNAILRDGISRAIGSVAVAVNNGGQAVGMEIDASSWGSHTRPVLWSGSNRTFLLGLGQIDFSGDVTGINDAGQIVGHIDLNGGRHAVLWNGASSPVDLGLGVTLNGINNSKKMVGTVTLSSGVGRATVWNGVLPFDLGTLDGNILTNSEALAINDVGQIVGISSAPGKPSHAVLWTLGATVPPVDFGATGRPVSINNSGKIVGYDNYNALLWVYGKSVTDLNIYLDASTRSAGWVLRRAHSINDSGWISGIAFNTLTGANRGFLLRPSGI